MKKLLLAGCALLSIGCSSSQKNLKISTTKSEQRNISSIGGRAFAVCAAKMNSQSLGNMNHDLTSIGSLYIVDVSSENKEALSNSLFCISEADEMKVIVSRLPDATEKSEFNEKRQMLIDVIDGKYFNKKVRIVLDRNYFVESDKDAIPSVRQIRILD